MKSSSNQNPDHYILFQAEVQLRVFTPSIHSEYSLRVFTPGIHHVADHSDGRFFQDAPKWSMDTGSTPARRGP